MLTHAETTFIETIEPIRPTDALVAAVAFGWTRISPNVQWNYQESESVWYEYTKHRRWNGLPPGPRDEEDDDEFGHNWQRVPTFTCEHDGIPELWGRGSEIPTLVSWLGERGYRVRVCWPLSEGQGPFIVEAFRGSLAELAYANMAETQQLALARIVLLIAAEERPTEFRAAVRRIHDQAVTVDREDRGREYKSTGFWNAPPIEQWVAA